MSSLLQSMLTKKKKVGGCWKIIFGRIESAICLIDIKAIGTWSKSNGRSAVFDKSCKGSDISNFKFSSLPTQPLNLVTKIMSAYCRRSTDFIYLFTIIVNIGALQQRCFRSTSLFIKFYLLSLMESTKIHMECCGIKNLVEITMTLVPVLLQRQQAPGISVSAKLCACARAHRFQ